MLKICVETQNVGAQMHTCALGSTAPAPYDICIRGEGAECIILLYYNQLRTRKFKIEDWFELNLKGNMHKSEIEDWFELDLKRNALRWSTVHEGPSI